MSTTTRFCILACEEILSPRSKLDTCPGCRANIHSWEKRTYGDRVRRTTRLTKYMSRMETLVDQSAVKGLIRTQRKKNAKK